MSAVLDATLTITAVPGHPQQRLATTTYVLEFADDDVLLGRAVDEVVRLHAVDEHDATVLPDTSPIVERRSTSVAAAGRTQRSVEIVVDRLALDVQQDWWSSGPAGETRPIMEWPDHVAADVVVTRGDDVVATATTPTVSGSWGVLGDDGTG